MLLSKELYEKCKSAYADSPALAQDLAQKMENDDRNVLRSIFDFWARINETKGISYDVVLNSNSLEELKQLAKKKQDQLRLRREVLEDCYDEYVQLYGKDKTEYLLYGEYLK